MSWTKKLSIVLVVAVALTAFGAGIASAQEGPRPRLQIRYAAVLLDALAEAAGTTPRELLAQWEAGTPLSDLAASLGVDAGAVVAQAEASISERIEQAVNEARLTREEADDLLATLPDDLNALMNEPRPEPAARPRERFDLAVQGLRILIETLAEQTGLEAADLLAQAREGAREGLTLADIAEVNGADPASVVEAAVATATERINEALSSGDLSQEEANQLLERLEPFFTNAMNHPLLQPNRPNQPQNVRQQAGLALVRAVSEATGLDAQTILEQLRAGATLAQIAETNGADVNAIVSQVAAQINERLEQELLDAMNRPWQPPRASAAPAGAPPAQ